MSGNNRTENQLMNNEKDVFAQQNGLTNRRHNGHVGVKINSDNNLGNPNQSDFPSSNNAIDGSNTDKEIISVEESEEKWADLDARSRLKQIAITIWKTLALFTLLYLFICSLDFLSTAFRLIAGKTTGDIFQQNEILRNPVVGVMIGVLVTVLVQSSSTATSIVVSMVSSGILEVHYAIPIIMGSNVGTSVTNTIVSLGQVGDRDNFERAFAGATVHDMFNWLSVIVLLIIEVTTGYLQALTGAIVSGMVTNNLTSSQGEPVDLLKTVTRPFTDTIIQIDKKVIEGWSTNDPKYENTTLLKSCTVTIVNLSMNSSDADFVETTNSTILSKKCPSYLMGGIAYIGDMWIGVILLILSIAMLIGCLILLVKVLNSVMKGHMATVIQRTINADIPYVPCLTGYIAIFVGCIMTILVQSSSVFTSSLTPLIGIGVISLERAYPLTLGSNIGTTTTAILASLAADRNKLQYSLQIALCHFFFNVTAILIFYPIPFMRWPIQLARILGQTTAKYRWFAVVYLIFMFFLLPFAIFGLSLAGSVTFYCIFGPIFIILITVAIVNVLQRHRPAVLPEKLRTWDWMPLPLRSLEPLDRIVTKLISCCRRIPTSPNKETLPLNSVFANGRSVSGLGIDNPSFHSVAKV